MKGTGIFLDTSVFVGAVVDRDLYHDASLAILRRAGQREWGRIWTSDFVFGEVLNYLARKRVPAGAVEAFLAYAQGSELRPASIQTLLRVSGPAFGQAIDGYVDRAANRLSFTDSGTLVLLAARGIGSLATFDAPLAAEARRRGIEVIGVPPGS